MKERIPSLVAAAVLAVTGIAGLVDGPAPTERRQRGRARADRGDVCAGPAADPGG